MWSGVEESHLEAFKKSELNGTQIITTSTHQLILEVLTFSPAIYPRHLKFWHTRGYLSLISVEHSHHVNSTRIHNKGVSHFFSLGTFPACLAESTVGGMLLLSFYPLAHLPGVKLWELLPTSFTSEGVLITRLVFLTQ